MSRPGARNAPRRPQASRLEAEFQRQVYATAKLYGFEVYHTHRSDLSEKGWPDLVLAKPPRLIFAELKSEKGRVSPEQRWWLSALTESGQEVALWRPTDLQTVVRVLGPLEQRAAVDPALLERWRRSGLVRPSHLRGR